MSRFPVQICVKRKANEEPVGALYLQAERQPKKALTEIAYRLWTEKDSFSRKVGLEKDSFTGPQVPKIRTSHPDEDRAQTRDRVPGMSQQSQVLQPPTLFQSAGQIPAKKPQRVFHLSRAQADLPFVPGHRGSGVHKRKREAKNKLATFIEGPRAIKKARSILDLNQSAEKNRVHDEGQNQKRENEAADLDQTVQPARQPPRKRPGASVAERKWRAETWAKKNAELDTPEQAATIQQNEAWTESSLKLAQKLHKFGLQETQPESAEKDTTEQQQEPTRVHLNHKPKVPADFHADHHPDGASRGSDMPPDTSTVPDEDEDYVMDVYVIETGNAEPSTMTSRMTVDASKPSLPSPESIGIIVIAEDEEDLWREFAELEHDEHDQNSEEEDENAEDFYGNDYPEEEVDSDDEFGRNPYKFRSNASAGEGSEVEDENDSEKDDDDDDDDAWSETDSRRHHPWTRHRWGV